MRLWEAENKVYLFQKFTRYRLGAFLVLCLMLGGTSQGIIAPKLPLYIASLFMIGAGFMALNSESRLWNMRIPLLLFGVYAALNFVYLIPLPPSIWAELPGREVVAQGFAALEMDMPWLPVSLTPEITMLSLFDFLPPFAVLVCAGTLASTQELKIAVWSVIIFAVLTVLLGVVQSITGDELLYFYSFTTINYPVGFFSNVNHQGSFLLMTLPFPIGLLIMATRKTSNNGNRKMIVIATCVVAVMSILVCILLTNSLAVNLLVLPVLLGAFFLCMLPGRVNFVLKAAIIVVAVALVGYDYLFLGNQVGEISREFTTLNPSARKAIFETTLMASKEFFPIGAGLGSFETVYHLFEAPAPLIVPHAHNDFLETVFELGLPGLILGGLFLIWWGVRAIGVVWSQQGRNIYAKCAFLSMASVIAHSMVEYPLRTIGLSSLFVFCLCIMCAGLSSARD